MGAGAAVVRVARAQIGTTERPGGSNRQRYGAAYGMDGVPWCAIFTWWCIREATGWDVREVAPGLHFTPDYRRQAVAAGWREVLQRKASPGDLAFFDFPDDVHRIQHVGLVVEARPDVLRTVEGNTSPGDGGSQANGGGVFARSRRYADVVAVVRPRWEDAMPTLDEVRGVVREELAAAVRAAWHSDHIDRPASWPPPAGKADPQVHPASALARLVERLDDTHAIVRMLGASGVPAADVQRLAAVLAPAVAAELANRLES